MRLLATILMLATGPLFVSRSFSLVQAFHTTQPPVLGAASSKRCGYRRLSKTPPLMRTERCENKAWKPASLSSPLFTASSLDGDDSPRNKQSRVRRFFDRAVSFLGVGRALSRSIRRWMVSMVLFMAITFSALDPAWAAGSGRAGGSFGRSDRFRHPPVSKVHRPSGDNRRIQSRQHRPAPIRVVYPPGRSNTNRIRNHSYRTYHRPTGEKVTGEDVAVVTNTDGTTNFVRKVNPHPFHDSRASDITVAVLSTALVTRGVLKRRSDREKFGDDDLSHPLGPGLSVWSLTACLNVPDIGAPTSVVQKIQRLAETTSTDTREGLQSLIAETALELARQVGKGTVASVESQYHHYRSSDQSVVRAERHYNRISARERSKFERESWSNYNGKIRLDDVSERDALSPSSAGGSIASLALVQIHLVIEGNTMEPFGTRQVETRKSLREALVQLSGDVTAVEDCVVAGEVLWAPQLQEQQEVMTEEYVYANYPRLWPLDYTK